MQSNPLLVIFKGSVALLAAFVALAALGATPAQALILQGEKWPHGIVAVCWRSDATTRKDFAELSGRIRSIVEDSWMRAANLQFVGWGTCPGQPSNPPAKTLVIHWQGQDPGETLPGWSDYGYDSQRRTAMYFDPGLSGDNLTVTVLMEFGHALGFGHEQDSPRNSNPTCRGTAARGATVLTPFDPESVMLAGYCRRTLGARLSPWDLVGVQNAYGRKASGSVVGLGSKCLDLPGNSSTVPTALQVYLCHGATNQQWLRQPDGTLRLAGSFTRCPDVPGGALAPSGGTVLNAYTCHGGPNQQFSFAGVELRGIGDLCVDVPGGSASAAYVQLYACHDGANQKWTIEKDGHIRSAATGTCLSAAASSSGTLLKLATCDPNAPSQRFTFTDLGEIQYGGSCVDAQNGNPVNGAKLQLYACKPKGPDKQNQQWRLRGPIHGLGGQCLDIRGAAPVDGAKAQLYPCHNGPNQTWDYYF